LIPELQAAAPMRVPIGESFVMHRQCAAAVLAAMLSATAAYPQNQQVQWTQTLNIPKGYNLPKGTSADVLGIELGDTYADAKAKLERLAAEAPSKAAPPTPAQTFRRALEPEKPQPPLSETKTVIFLPVPSGPQIEASYVGFMILRRALPGADARGIEENIYVRLSSPASGHQVVAIERSLIYSAQGDQPRAGELLGQLRQKFKAEPETVTTTTTGAVYRFQFDDGRIFVPAKNQFACSPVSAMQHTVSARDIPTINSSGNCDVVLEIAVNYGISSDHVKSIIFRYGDNQRAKENLTADFAFFDGYVKNVQQRTKGAAPKL
jgi:hypothetical protein